MLSTSAVSGFVTESRLRSAAREFKWPSSTRECHRSAATEDLWLALSTVLTADLRKPVNPAMIRSVLVSRRVTKGSSRNPHDHQVRTTTEQEHL